MSDHFRGRGIWLCPFGTIPGNNNLFQPCEVSNMKFSAIPSQFGLVLFLAAFLFIVPNLLADDARLPAPPDPEIEKLIQEGKFEVALGKLIQREQASSGELDLGLLVMKAELLERTGSNEESIAAWNGVALREPALKYYSGKRVTGLWLKEGNAKEAELSLKRVAGGTSDKKNLDHVLGLAQLFLEQENYKEAETLFLQALKLVRRGEKADLGRIGLARSRIALSNVAEAITNLRYMQVNFRSVDLLKESIALEKQISKSVKPLDEEEYRVIIDRLIDHSSFVLAQEILKSWRRAYPQSRQQDRMDFFEIEALYRQRENEAALKLCQQFNNSHPKSGLAFPIYFKELLLYQRTGQTEKLLALGQQLWQGKLGGTMASRRNVGLVMASYLVSVGQVEEGLEYYRQVYRSGPGSNSRNDILWRVGVGAIRGGQEQRAVNNLRLLLKKNPRGETLASVLYWLAKAELAVGDKKASLTHLIRLDEEFPNHYYNVMSQKDLAEMAADEKETWVAKTREKYKKESEKFPELTISSIVKKHKYYIAAALLSQAGLAEDAADFAADLQRVFRKDMGVAMLVARAHSKAGNHIKAVRTIYNNFRSYLYQKTEGLPEDFWTLYYPRPYWQEVSASAAKHNIDPALLVSLMRQESRFDPNAKSWIGAIGLFQIMPYTAEEIAPQIGMEKISEEDLYQPEINVAVAAELASRLFQYFDNDRVPIIASYNAGEDRVQVWWEAARNEKISEALFIDTIPYKETRGFVREVLSNYFSYKRIYGQMDQQSE